MATHSSVLAWKIPGTGAPGGLLSMGPHRVGHNGSDLAAAAAAAWLWGHGAAAAAAAAAGLWGQGATFVTHQLWQVLISQCFCFSICKMGTLMVMILVAIF